MGSAPGLSELEIKKEEKSRIRALSDEDRERSIRYVDEKNPGKVFCSELIAANVIVQERSKADLMTAGLVQEKVKRKRPRLVWVQDALPEKEEREDAPMCRGRK